ncbi:MAG: CNP1-like family protein [Rhodocyclaceae bacterium]
MSIFLRRLVGAAFHSTALVLAGAHGVLHAGFFGDPNENWVEDRYEMPAPPGEALRAYSPGGEAGHRYFIDEASLAIGGDGVVRYVLVIEASGGARNVTFEGLRCVTREHRIYATGRDDGSWQVVRESEWKPLFDNAYNRARVALAKDILCDGPVPPRDRADALRRLRSPQGPSTGN